MNYRKFGADKLFDGFHFLEEAQVVVTDENGVMQGIIKKEDAGENVLSLDGILVPGLINAHCHVELSHMKDVIPPHTGLIDFLISVVTKRGTADESFIRKKIAEAEDELYRNGIVAIADIVNTEHALETKQQSKLRWYNLTEVLNIFDKTFPERWKHNQQILSKHLQVGTGSVLTPHAPYTVSAATFQALNDATAGQVISIHNQETKAENELFEKGTGDFLRLFSSVGFEASPFEISGRSSLQTWLPYFTNGQTIILVHNTFIDEEDILFAKSHAEKYSLKIVYCLCPNANLYIENALPPLNLLVDHECTIVLGTDSYSSNWQLSIAEEMRTLQKKFPHYSLETILQWASSNAAGAFGWKDLGTLKKGAQPGLVLLETNSENQQILTGKASRVI